jgi:hypothetical protein
MALIAEAVVGQLANLLTVVAMITVPIAWILGRSPERALAMATAMMIFLEQLGQTYSTGDSGVAAFRPDHALLDTLLLLCVGAVALRANRFYPMVMTSAALIAVLAHGLRWLGLIDGRFAYQVLTTVPALVMVLTFWTGLGLHLRRERRFGLYPDWRGAASTANDCRPAQNGIA